jgi:hypothetical protein
MDAWFECGGTLEVIEEVVGLGNYGRILSGLWGESLPDRDDEEESAHFSSRRRVCVPPLTISASWVVVAKRVVAKTLTGGREKHTICGIEVRIANHGWYGVRGLEDGNQVSRIESTTAGEKPCCA